MNENYTIKFVLQNCKYLERMDLEECSQITDVTLAHLATGCPSLEKLVGVVDTKELLKLFFISIASFLHRPYHIVSL